MLRTMAIACCLVPTSVLTAEFTLEPHGEGRSILRENGAPVLVYNHGDQLESGFDADRTRSCYVHPLYGLDGEMLTDDFPPDHPHHRGASMMWPRVSVGTKPVDHWHIEGIRTRNEELSLRVVGDAAVLDAENVWMLEDGTIAAREQTQWTVRPADQGGRIIDVESTITAGDEPITLRGAAQPKGYGGHVIRFSPRTDQVITTDLGVVEGDRDRLPYRWADCSATSGDSGTMSGLTLMPHPDGRDYPPSWQLRRFGMLGIAWPGLGRHVLPAGDSITLAYRAWIHRGDSDGSQAAWADWMRELGRSNPIAARRRLLHDDDPTTWRRVGTANFERNDGILHGWGNEPRNSFYVGPEVADFELEMEFKPEPGSNSGIQIRSRITPDGQAVRGYQVEIDTSERAWTGGLYDERRRGWLESLADDPIARSAMLPDRWNHLRIVMEGPHLRTWVNGVPCVDSYDSMDMNGILAFQVHGGGCDMQWRNVSLTPLGRHDWTPLFDGTLDGWRPHGGGDWTIEDGVLVGRQRADDPEHGHLVFDALPRDFTLRLRFKSPRGNSGVYFRAERSDASRTPGIAGFQAEIDGHSGMTGGLYETGGRGWVIPVDGDFPDRYRSEQWNTMTISADGPRVVVHVNGSKTADLVDAAGRRDGVLALQLHGGEDMEVRFQSVELLEPDVDAMRSNGRTARDE